MKPDDAIESGAGTRAGDGTGLGVDWGFVASGLGSSLIGATFIVFTLAATGLFMDADVADMFIDAHVYFRATEAWIAGGNPWAASGLYVSYAAPPPALLLNLLLTPFGESVAVVFWIITNAVSIAYLLRRFRLPLYWVAFWPIAEGFLSGSPDLTLAALAVRGVGGITALAKPYAIPAMLAARRFQAIVLAVIAGVVSLPLLPWREFVESRELVGQAFNLHGFPPSAAGEPLLMGCVAVALVTLGARRALALATPGLLAMQPHYLAFSLDTIASSRILTLAMCLPVERAAAVGIVIFAVVELWRGRGRTEPKSLDA